MPTSLAKKSDAVADLLRRKGARATPARIRVLRLLSESPTPLSHGEIETALGLPTLDRVTLYRVLEHLVDCGLALKNADSNRVFRFSPAPGGEHSSHIHFRCEQCGGIYCLDASPPSPPQLPAGFELAHMNLDLRGACARCTAKNKRTKSVS